MTIRATSDRAQRICKALGFPPNPFERAPHKSAYEVLFHTRLEIAYFFSFSFALWFYMGLSPLAPTQGQQGDFKIAMTCIFLLTLPLSYMIHNPRRYGYAGAIALYIGWMSNIVYHLDWDQQWQKYPWPTIGGLVSGNVVGAVYYKFFGDATITMD